MGDNGLGLVLKLAINIDEVLTVARALSYELRDPAALLQVLAHVSEEVPEHA
jgi:hypothetical protein